LSIDEHRQSAITAAVGAFNQANLREPLPRNAGRLLIAIFPEDDACQQSQSDLAGEGFSKNSLPGVLRRLVRAGLVSRHRVAVREGARGAVSLLNTVFAVNT
jgi:hypothetical protein